MRVTVRHHEAFFYPLRITMIDFRVYLSSSRPAFDLNVGVAMNESRSFALTSTKLKMDVVCGVAMTSTNILTTGLRDRLYDQYIDNTCCYSFFFLYVPRVG